MQVWIQPNQDNRWDQMVRVQFALSTIDERAPEALAAATNHAARKIRQRIVDKLSSRMTLPVEEIEQYVKVDAEATEGNPAARITITYGAEPLEHFPYRQDAHGMYVQIYKDEPERFITEGFIPSNGSLPPGIYQRKMIGKKRAGRLPLSVKFGPSVLTTFETTPGMKDEMIDWAEEELVRNVEQARDIVIQDAGTRDIFLPTLTADDPRFDDLNFYVNNSLETRFDNFISTTDEGTDFGYQIDLMLGFSGPTATGGDNLNAFDEFLSSTPSGSNELNSFDRFLSSTPNSSNALNPLDRFLSNTPADNRNSPSFRFDRLLGFTD